MANGIARLIMLEQMEWCRQGKMAMLCDWSLDDWGKSSGIHLFVIRRGSFSYLPLGYVSMEQLERCSNAYISSHWPEYYL